MSQEEDISRREKRALRDAERHKQGKKRKHAEANEPGEQQDSEKYATEEQSTVSVVNDESREHVEHTKLAAVDTTTRKKRRTASHEIAGDDNNHEETTAESTRPKPSKSRFIVFVGNLPYKTTDSSLRTHFQKLEPFLLRHRTDPKSKQSKGFAFLEFENYDRMKTCLKLYHHSMFDPADPGAGENILKKSDQEEKGESRRGKKTPARRINVELTAGGGGKTNGRKEKIRAKNMKLEDERKRRMEAERKEKDRKEKREVKKKASADEDTAAEAMEVASHGIHPSRLARLNV